MALFLAWLGLDSILFFFWEKGEGNGFPYGSNIARYPNASRKEEFPCIAFSPGRKGVLVSKKWFDATLRD